tara:strand:+ start:1486 stop:2448 length:963 start_codon:yes stop_codon:yes gene_type:complete
MSTIGRRVSERKKYEEESKKATEENMNNREHNTLVPNPDTVASIVGGFYNNLDLINLALTSKTLNTEIRKKYGPYTSMVGRLDDGQFIDLWNNRGIQDYYYSIPVETAEMHEDGVTNIRIMYVIPKDKVFDYVDRRRSYYSARNDWYWYRNIGLYNRITFNGKKFQVYDFPHKIPEFNEVLKLKNKYKQVLRRRYNFEEDFPVRVSYEVEQQREQQQQFTDVPDEKYTKAYILEMKDFVLNVYLSDYVRIIPLEGNLEKFKKNLIKFYRYITCANSDEPSRCSLMGGKKKKKRRRTKKKRRRRTKKKRRRTKKKRRRRRR